MKIWKATAIMFIFTMISVVLSSRCIFPDVARAQYTSPAIDFFMHDRLHETFLRDHYRFEETKPLRIEYWYINWLDSGSGADEYRDHLHVEGTVPVYMGKRLMVDIPFQYSRIPVWGESEGLTFGNSINVLEPSLIARWIITDSFRSIIGWEYNLKGDDENFGKSGGRDICLLKAFFSYNLHTKLNFVAGASLDRYYYDTYEESDAFKLADRLYYHPVVMLNWHPNGNFTMLLGIPAMGAQIAFGRVLKAEVRATNNRKIEIASRIKPLERTNITLRYLSIPYTETPMKGPLAERLHYVDRSILFEIGRELNPAALASLGFRYSFGGDMEFKDRHSKDIIKLDGKPHFVVGATFTVDIEALTGVR